MSHTSSPGLAALPLLLLAACASGPQKDDPRIVALETLTRNGDYEAAAAGSVDLLQALESDDELRPQVVALQEDISVASGLATVRELVFADREAEALPIVEELKAAHGELLPVLAWEDRVRKKIADNWFEVARAAVAEERFDDARAAYAKSVEYDPSRAVVQQLLSQLDRVEEWRAEEADRMYYSGVGNLVDGRLLEAAGEFGKVGKYRENPERANRRVSEVNRLLAQTRIEAADALVKEGHFSAAAKEYEEAARLDPESEAIAADLERMKREAGANQILIEGRSMILRGELDRGGEELKKGLELTELQKDAFQVEIDGIAARRVQSRYDRALGLEHDFQFPEAVAAYEGILEDRDYYKDCRARIDILNDKIGEAERLYAEAAEAEDGEAKLALLRQIEVFWPDYEDIPAQIRELSGKK